MEKNKKSVKANILNMQEVQAAAECLAEDYIQFLNYMGNNTVKLTAEPYVWERRTALKSTVCSIVHRRYGRGRGAHRNIMWK